MKIKDTSTLADLGVALGKLGVRDFTGGIAPGHVRAYRVVLSTRDFSATGDGNSLGSAFDDAVARVEHRSAEAVASEDGS